MRSSARKDESCQQAEDQGRGRLGDRAGEGGGRGAQETHFRPGGVHGRGREVRINLYVDRVAVLEQPREDAVLVGQVGTEEVGLASIGGVDRDRAEKVPPGDGCVANGEERISRAAAVVAA